jgi:polyribonucleotide nucleotidyltransferase
VYLLHISKLSKQRVEKASDILSVGQEIQVKVLKVQKDRIELGLN